MLKKSFIYVFSVFFIGGALSQDVHFSQIIQTPQFINPALTGHFDGWERLNLSHRQQWNSVGSPFITSGAGLDLNFFKQEYGAKKAHMGVGLSFFNDMAGEPVMSTNQGMFSLSAIVPLSEKHIVSVGFQGGMAQRSGNINSHTWGNQFDGTNFDTGIPSGEENAMASFIYPDFGAGVTYTFENMKSTLIRKELTRLTIGGAYHHFNSPVVTFYSGNTSSLFHKISAHLNFLWDIPKSQWAIETSGAYFMQGPFTETYGGLLFKNRVKQGTKYTGIFKEGYFCIGSNVRLNNSAGESIIPVIALEMGHFRLGVSYDVVISRLQAPSNMQGGFEVSFQWMNKKDALFKRRRGSFNTKGGSGA